MRINGGAATRSKLLSTDCRRAFHWFCTLVYDILARYAEVGLSIRHCAFVSISVSILRTRIPLHCTFSTQYAFRLQNSPGILKPLRNEISSKLTHRSCYFLQRVKIHKMKIDQQRRYRISISNARFV